MKVLSAWIATVVVIAGVLNFGCKKQPAEASTNHLPPPFQISRPSTEIHAHKFTPLEIEISEADRAAERFVRSKWPNREALSFDEEPETDRKAIHTWKVYEHVTATEPNSVNSFNGTAPYVWACTVKRVGVKWILVDAHDLETDALTPGGMARDQ